MSAYVRIAIIGCKVIRNKDKKGYIRVCVKNSISVIAFSHFVQQWCL